MNTTISNPTAADNFSDLFERFKSSLNGSAKHPIFSYQQRAADTLSHLRFPTRRDEDWKYTSVAPIVNQEYALPSPAHSSGNAVHFKDTIRLNFVNGKFRREELETVHLPDGLHLLSMAEALVHPTFKSAVERRMEAWLKSGDPFTVMNVAFSPGGLFIAVDKGVQIDTMIHIHYTVSNEDQPQVLNPQRLIMVADNASLRFVETFEGPQNAYWSNDLMHAEVGANALLKHYKLQTLPEQSYQINQMDVVQQRDSLYCNLAVDLGGKTVRNNLRAHQEGSNITSNFFGVYIARNRQHIDHQTFIDHAHPHCQSNELYKGIIMDRANGVFNGKVMVRQDAQKINAFQQNSTLVLSDKASMESKPQLEIFADDVRCSHGATIGQLDESAIFYLKTRGLSEQLARKLLQQAFVAELMDEIDDDAIKAYTLELLENKLS